LKFTTFTSVAAVALVTASCTPRGNWLFSYEHPCFVKVRSELELDDTDLHYLYRNYDIARDMYEGFFTGDGEGSYCKLTKQYTLWIHKRSFPCPMYDGSCSGFFNVSIGIEVTGPRVPALLHETLHARDAARGIISTVWHEGWDTNGYYVLDEEYSRLAMLP